MSNDLYILGGGGPGGGVQTPETALAAIIDDNLAIQNGSETANQSYLADNARAYLKSKGMTAPGRASPPRQDSQGTVKPLPNHTPWLLAGLAIATLVFLVAKKKKLI